MPTRKDTGIKIESADFVIKQMEQIERIQQHLEAVSNAVAYLRRDRQGEQIDHGNITTLLLGKELDAWRNLFLMGLTVAQPLRDRIKAAGRQRFLDDGQNVSHWWNDGVAPSRWLTADEDAFREMVRKAFAPENTK